MKVRKEMSKNHEADPPAILVATDGVNFYPSLEKHEIAKGIRKFIEKSGEDL